MVETVTLEKLSQVFPSLSGREVHYLDIGGDTPLAVRARPAPGANALVILFHGAVDRESRTLPSFLGYRRGIYPHAHQLALADPALSLSDHLRAGWFAGAEGTPLQSLLPPLLHEFARRHQIQRVVFAGSSAGGLAALYYSWHFPGSIAVAAAPQTSVQAYFEWAREAYLETAWPNLANIEIGRRPCLDLRDMYGRGMENTVVYLQSSLDELHVRNHMVPFLECLPRPALRRVALNCSFWGKRGHGGSVPAAVMDAWIRASLLAQGSTAEAVVLAHHVNSSDADSAKDGASAPLNGRRPPKQATVYEPRDLRIASQLTEELLKKGISGHG